MTDDGIKINENIYTRRPKNTFMKEYSQIDFEKSSESIGDNAEYKFDENKYEYNLEIGDDNYLVIDAVPDVETSKVEITGNLDLVDGSIIKIRVEYDDDNYNIYKINIIKKEVVNKENNFNKIVILIVIALILTAIIVLLIIQIKNKKNKNKTNASDKNTKEKDTKEVKQEDTNLETKNNNIITLSDDEEIEDII